LPAQGRQQFRLGELEEICLPVRADLNQGDMGEPCVRVGAGGLEIRSEIRAARFGVCSLPPYP
jgi:hypothetical protein